MKYILILMILLLPSAKALVFENATNPVVIDAGSGTNVHVTTSRRVDQPTLRYRFEKTDGLTNSWSTVSTFKGDGSSIALQDMSFSISNAPLSTEFESIGFSEALDSAPAGFYRMSYWWVSTPISEFTDDVDETYVRIRSRDGSKYLYQDPDTGVLSYEAGMDLLDFRSHWYIQTSTQTNRYWIRNRLTRQAIHTATSGVGGASGATLLLDFGTSGTYRGADVSSPDSNGHYWNGVGYSGATDMVDVSNNVTGIDVVTTTSYGTDFYNGPSGPVQDPAQTVYNSIALGDLGINEAVYDYFGGDASGGYEVKFELRDLDPALKYSLTFYGSHKYNTDNTTRYAVTDSSGAILDSGDLLVGVNAAHNQDTVVTLSNLSPDAGNRIYVQFVGTGGSAGYLNAMKIEIVDSGSPTNETGTALLVDNLVPSSSNYRWIVDEQPGFFWIENASETNRYITVDTASAGTASHADLNPDSEDQKFIIEPLPRGALMPWTSYDEDNYASMGNGAQLLPFTYDRLETHSEAQKRSAILLDQENAFVKWSLEEDANAFVLRYAIEDAPSGGGLNGAVTMVLRDGGGSLVESNTIPVTSEQAWLYFDINMNESDNPADGRPAKRFNEARVKLSSIAAPGYSLELHRGTGEPLIWIDVIETELVDPPITVNPAAYYSVTDYGAVPGDGNDDRGAFISCINAAKSAGKGVYIPAGVFELNDRVAIGDVVLQGAGMWHTELHFTSVNGGVNNIGFWGQGSSTEVHDLYMRTESTYRGGGGNAFRQYFGTGSRIDSVWMEHFDVGGWIGDYIAPYDVSDGLVFFNCRVRNTFADGINYARGTRNSIIDNCHFRSTGDDSIASWSSDTTSVPQCENNRFRYNTAELNWRAAGIGVFGGEAHKVHHNIVSDVVSGAAMRFNTTFANGTQGYDFSANGVMSIYRNSLYRSGTDGGYNAVPTKQGAINLVTTYGDVRNIQFKDIYIDDVLNRGVFVDRQYWGTGGSVTNITFNGMIMTNMVIGTYVNGTAIGSMEYTDVSVSLDPVRGIAVEVDGSPNFEIIHTP